MHATPHVTDSKFHLLQFSVEQCVIVGDVQNGQASAVAPIEQKLINSKKV